MATFIAYIGAESFWNPSGVRSMSPYLDLQIQPGLFSIGVQGWASLTAVTVEEVAVTQNTKQSSTTVFIPRLSKLPRQNKVNNCTPPTVRLLLKMTW